MAQYIPKAAVVAEIERRLDVLANTSAGDNKEFAAIIGAQYYELINLVQYINTLEVKEVDLEKEIDDWYNTVGIPVTADALKETANHFFELGIKAAKKGE